MTRRLSIMLALGAFALPLLGACGGGSGSGASSKCPAKVETRTAVDGAITVCASDIKFDVVTITAEPGPLTVTLENDGAIYHTLRILDTDLVLKTNPGKTASDTVTLEKGTYEFDCDVPGHATGGMKGKIVVG
jgi:plastocyanin